MAEVEEFHARITRPSSRPMCALICVETGRSWDEISNFDLRPVQPNENAIPTGAWYTIEHFLASLLRDQY